MTSLVTLNQKEVPTTTSLLIAEKFNKEHKTVLRNIRNLDCSESFSRHNFAPRNYKKRGKEYPFYEITKDGFAMLVMGFTGKEAAQWKELYIRQFNKMYTKLQQIALERQSTEWNLDRIEGKMQRRKLTDTIAPFQIYALNQGSEGTAKAAYSNFTRLVNKYAEIKAGQRDMLTGDMLRYIQHLEGVVEMKIKEYMQQGIYCKDIYKQVKVTLENYCQLVPYTGEVYLPKSVQVKLVA